MKSLILLGFRPFFVAHQAAAEITKLYRMGVDPITVSRLVGHSRPQTTMQLYGFSDMDAMRSAVALFDAV